MLRSLPLSWLGSKRSPFQKHDRTMNHVLHFEIWVSAGFTEASLFSVLVRVPPCWYSSIVCAASRCCGKQGPHTLHVTCRYIADHQRCTLVGSIANLRFVRLEPVESIELVNILPLCVELDMVGLASIMKLLVSPLNIVWGLRAILKAPVQPPGSSGIRMVKD